MIRIQAVNDPEQEIERLGNVIVPYLCERTGLQKDQIERVMEAIEEFWEGQPHVVAQMFIFGAPVDDAPRD